MMVNLSLYEVIAVVLALAAAVLAIIALLRLRRMGRIYSVIFGRSSSSSLDDVISSHQESIERLIERLEDLDAKHETLAGLQRLNVQKVGLVRFNSFSDTGGNNSFALAILDSNDTGVVVSSLYGRDMSRAYAKKVVKGESDIPLTEEEKAAILESQRGSTAETPRKRSRR